MLRPIGFIESCFREKFGTPRQGSLVPRAPARLRVLSEFLPGQSLVGLSEFSHVWLIFQFHLNTNKGYLSKIHPPRLRGGTIGVFACRSPHRPNPIGLTLARLTAIEGDTLLLTGVDLVNGTPVLDIKPYLPACDRPSRPRIGWVDRCRVPRLEVEFTKSALADLRRVVPVRIRSKVKRLMESSLSHDPRNLRDRAQLRPDRVFAFFVLHYDAHFHIQDGRAQVFCILPADEAARRRPPLTPGLF